MAILSKTLLSAAATTGPGTAQDLAAMARSLTMQVVLGAVNPDPGCVVQLEGSLDNVNFWSLGRVTGNGNFNNDQDVVQYVRANVISIASGTVTAYLAFASG